MLHIAIISVVAILLICAEFNFPSCSVLVNEHTCINSVGLINHVSFSSMNKEKRKIQINDIVFV